tara:strand:+ start:191 stop:334 length:144 start_codon:yes stop_codon:yes gene_type:complete
MAWVCTPISLSSRLLAVFIAALISQDSLFQAQEMNRIGVEMLIDEFL